MTLESLVEDLDAELAWRRLELSALRTGMARAKGQAQGTSSRAAIALAYAHWEGYVVAASRRLMAYVKGLRLSYEDLSDSYLALCLAGRLREAEMSTRRIRRHIDVVVAMRESDQQAIFPRPERVIQARGNLDSEKLDDILTRLSIDPSPFELHYNWLDSELLRRRNSIAHGEHGYADSASAEEALATVGTLIDSFRTAAQNAAAEKVYSRE